MKLYQVGRAIVFGDQGFQLAILKTFRDKELAEEFKRISQGDLERDIPSQVRDGQGRYVGTVMQMYVRLGVTEVHTVLVEREVEDTPRILTPRLVVPH